VRCPRRLTQARFASGTERAAVHRRPVLTPAAASGRALAGEVETQVARRP
jgi:hypothetical protein